MSSGLNMRFPKAVASLLAALALSSTVPAQQVSPPRIDLVERIAKRLEAKLATDKIPGLSCAIAVAEEVVFARGFGVSDLENDVAATEHTVYRLASISKPITAVLAMQLAEAGTLDLDVPVHTLVRSWPEKRWPVSTRQLLGHLGGVRHYKLGEGESVRRYPNQTAALARFADDDLVHAPGTRFLYSTYGFNLAAAVLEARTGESFAELVCKRVAIPCGAASLQDDDQRRLIKHRAQGYRRFGGGLGNSRLMDSSYKLGGGGLCASALDLLKFARALLAGKLLPPECLAEMWSSGRDTSGKQTGYGLGFAVRARDGVRIVAHSGAQSRVSTMLAMLPEERICVVLMCNFEQIQLSKLATDLAFEVRANAGHKTKRNGGER